MSADSSSNPLDMLKSLWGGFSTPLPGFVTPTLDADELEKRIKDLKAVEGWLKTNLGMLQMTIQGLEVQRNTLEALKAVAAAAQNPEVAGHQQVTGADFSAWPLQFMQAAGSAFMDATKSATDMAKVATDVAGATADATAPRPRARKPSKR